MNIKFLRRKKLLKYWIFYNGISKFSFKSNYELLSVLSNVGCFVNFKNLLLNLKKIVPLLWSVSNNNIMLVGTTNLFSKSISDKKYNSKVNELQYKKLGLFCNFYVMSTSIFDSVVAKKNPTFVIFWNVHQNSYIVAESKKKLIPSIGLVSSNSNSLLIDYPIIVNSTYFYTVFFLSKFLFKLLVLQK